MPQKQNKVEVSYLNGKKGVAIATGNNASWNCICGYQIPLIGKAYNIKGPTPKTYVECTKCMRRFYVFPKEKSFGKVDRIEEIKKDSVQLRLNFLKNVFEE